MASKNASSEEWHELLMRMAQSSASKPVWVIVQSGILEMCATKCRISVDANTLHVYLQSVEHPAVNVDGISVFLPNKDDTIYTTATNESGDAKIVAEYLGTSASSRFGDPVRVTITDQAELLRNEETEFDAD